MENSNFGKTFPNGIIIPRNGLICKQKFVFTNYRLTLYKLFTPQSIFAV